jgi:two-component system, sensor histidine kinase and response regulator
MARQARRWDRVAALLLLLHAALLALPAVAGPVIEGGWVPSAQRFTAADGLPDRTLFSLAQDHDGFLWIGSVRGLVRFDGRRFQVLRHDPADPESLPSDNAGNVFHDSRGRLWVGCWGAGLAIVDPRSGRARRLQFDPADPDSLVSNYVQRIFEDRAGTVWIGTGAGLMRYDEAAGRLRRVWNEAAGAELIDALRIWSIDQDSQGRLWLASSRGLVRHDPARGDTRVFAEAVPAGERPERLRLAFVDAEDRIWLGSDSAIGRFDPERGVFTPIAAPGAAALPVPNTVFALDATRFLLGTFTGLWLLDTAEGALQPLSGGHHYPWFPADDVRAVLRDASGLYWLATRFNGLIRLRLDRPQHRLQRVGIDADDDPARYESVRLLQPDGERLWLVTDGGLVGTDLAATRFTPVPGTGRRRLGSIGAIALGERGELWLPSWFGPARLMPAGTPRLMTELLAEARLQDPNMAFVIRDSRDRLWWGSLREGLLQTDLAGRLTARHPRGEAGPGRLPNAALTCAHEDALHRLWFCSDAGLVLLVSEANEFLQFRHDPTHAASLSSDQVISLHGDRRGRLWVGTARGLDRLDPVTGGFEHFLPEGEHGFAVESIIEADDGTLRVASGNRLYSVDAASGRFVGAPLTIAEPGLSFHARAAARGADGSLLFGSNRGLLVLRGNGAPDAPFQPPVAIVGSWVDRQPLAIGLNAASVAEVVLRPQASTLEFEYTALDLRAPERNRYRYRLHGFDPDWVEAGDARIATYTNLAPGSYRFEVHAAGLDQAWSEQPASLALRVLPPWWRDPRWQMAIGLLLVLAAGGAGQLALLARRARRQQLLRAVEQVRRELLQRNEELSQLDFLIQGLNRESGNRISLEEPARRLLRLLPAGSALAVLLKRRGVDTLVPLVAVGYPQAAPPGRFAQPLPLAALALDDALPMAQGVHRLRRPADVEAPPVSLLLRADLRRDAEVLLLFEHLQRADGFDQVELERLRRCREHMLLAVDKWLRQADLAALRSRLDATAGEPMAEVPG